MKYACLLIIVVLLYQRNNCYGALIDINPRIKDSSTVNMHYSYSNTCVIGVHRFRNLFFELGYSRSKQEINRLKAYSISINYNYWSKVGGGSCAVWTNEPLCLGLDFNFNGRIRKPYKYDPIFAIRPFIGFGGRNFTFSYGYNFYINQKDISISNIGPSLNYHVISGRCFFDL